MSDKRDEIYSLMARVNLRRNEAQKKNQEIGLGKRHAFTGTQARIEILRRRAEGGDEAAKAAYMALLRGKKAAGG